MSSVKLHLPWYDDYLLQHIKNIKIKYVKIININDIKSRSNKTKYQKICKEIFDNYKFKIILLGNFSAYPLPIPNFTKVISSGITININDGEKYVEYGYRIINKEDLIKQLSGFICSTSLATFSMIVNKKPFVGDVYHLWYVTKFNKVYQIKRDTLIKKVYQVKEEKDYENVVLWSHGDKNIPHEGNVTYASLIKHQKNYQRTQEAKMDYPIQVYKDKGKYYILDGVHRTARAYQNKIPTINVQYVTKKQLEKTKITNKDIKSLEKKCIKKN